MAHPVSFAEYTSPTAVNAGYVQGERIGEWVYEHALQPVNPPPTIAASPVSEKAEHWKLRKIMVGEDSGQKLTDLGNQ